MQLVTSTSVAKLVIHLRIFKYCSLCPDYENCQLYISGWIRFIWCNWAWLQELSKLRLICVIYRRLRQIAQNKVFFSLSCENRILYSIVLLWIRWVIYQKTTSNIYIYICLTYHVPSWQLWMPVRILPFLNFQIPCLSGLLRKTKVPNKNYIKTPSRLFLGSAMLYELVLNMTW